MAEIKTAFSARPGALAKPVPKQTPLPEETEMENPFDGMQMALPEAGALPEAEAVESNPFDGMQMAEGSDVAEFEAEPTMMEANTPGPDVISNFVTRLQAGLAANDNQKLGLLKKKLGDKNAMVKDGKIYYRKDGGKFKRLDPEAFELVNDLIPDFAREIITEAAMLPGEISGGIVGSAVATPGAGTAGGAIVGRVASVPMANELADTVARAAGVPDDPTRNRTVEDVSMMAGEAVLPAAGKYVAKFIPGTAAYKMAKEMGETEVTALSRQSKEVIQAATELHISGQGFMLDGAAVGMPGARVNLMAHMMHPDSPEIKRLVDAAGGSEKFQAAQNQLAEGWGDAAKNMLREIAMRNSKGPVSDEVLGSTVKNAVHATRKAEGEAIKAYRIQALKKSGNKRELLPKEVNNQITEMLGELGFSRKVKQIETYTKREYDNPILQQTQQMYKKNKVDQVVFTPPKDVRGLIGKYGITSEGEAQALVNVLNDLQKMNDPSRGMRLTDLERARNMVGDLGDRFAGTPVEAHLANLSGKLREQYRAVIAKNLPTKQDGLVFNGVMTEYSTIMTNMKQLKDVLKDNASAQAVVNTIFTGKENLNKIRAIKSLAPETMPALKEAWINQMLVDYSNTSMKTGIDSTKFLNDLNKKYGDQFLKEVLNDGPGPNMDSIKKILAVTQRIEQQTKNVKVDNMSEGAKQGVINTLIGGVMDVKFKMINGVQAMMRGRNGADNAAIEIMTRDGIDKYIAKYPGKIKDKAGVIQNLKDLVAQSKAMKALEANSQKAIDSTAGKAATRAGRRLGVEKMRPEQQFEEGENRD